LAATAAGRRHDIPVVLTVEEALLVVGASLSLVVVLSVGIGLSVAQLRGPVVATVLTGVILGMLGSGGQQWQVYMAFPASWPPGATVVANLYVAGDSTPFRVVRLAAQPSGSP
jgi:hypothetical protein